MTEISKFYFHDAPSPVGGILPFANFPLKTDLSGAQALSGNAAGLAFAIWRDATDVIGTANPDVETLVTATADTSQQAWGHRRFLSRPLAAQTMAAGATWTFRYARTQSNTAHHQIIRVVVWVWTPSTGTRNGGVGDGALILGTDSGLAAPAVAEAVAGAWGGTPTTLLDGDLLVFDVSTVFTQTMATAYTDSFSYDGVTEGDPASSASYIAPPVPVIALDLSAAATFLENEGASHIPSWRRRAVPMRRGPDVDRIAGMHGRFAR